MFTLKSNCKCKQTVKSNWLLTPVLTHVYLCPFIWVDPITTKNEETLLTPYSATTQTKATLDTIKYLSKRIPKNVLYFT